MITVDEAKEKRKRMEDGIEASIRHFEEATGLTVVAVHVSRSHELGGTSVPNAIFNGVETKIEL